MGVHEQKVNPLKRFFRNYMQLSCLQPYQEYRFVPLGHAAWDAAHAKPVPPLWLHFVCLSEGQAHSTEELETATQSVQ